jgi:hypothetical protein
LDRDDDDSRPESRPAELELPASNREVK